MNSPSPKTTTYLDTATYGLPCAAAQDEALRILGEWSRGDYDPLTCDRAIAETRSAFARLHRVKPAQVAIGHQVAPFVALIAGALDRNANVLAVEGDFTSLLYPFLAAGCAVRTVALERLAESIEPQTDLVAVSAVQSADGRVADLAAIATAARHHGVATLVDSTQASGWLPIDARDFDVVVCGGYKWLSQPRGTAFMAIDDRFRDRVPPRFANWFSAPDPWSSIYGVPLRLASDARRFDVSPAWLNWHVAAVSMAAIEQLGVDAIHRHDVALANRLRLGLGMAAGDSAIVSTPVSASAVARLADAGCRVSSRAGRLRVSPHHYNDEDDIARVLEVLEPADLLAA